MRSLSRRRARNPSGPFVSASADCYGVTFVVTLLVLFA